MSRGRRDRHVGKTPEEQRAYVSTVREAPGPTAGDDLREPDATEIVAPSETRPAARVPTREEHPPLTARLGSHLRENVGAIFWTALAGAMVYLYSLAMSLNREVGELKAATTAQGETLRATAARLDAAMEKIEQRATKSEERLDQFIEQSLRERTRTEPPVAPPAPTVPASPGKH